MLFDLRGRGRRRTIQVIYLFLAVLIGGGLIFFGIGGGAGSGGLLNAVNNGPSGSSTFNKRLRGDERRANATPSDPAAWATVANDHYQLAISTVNQTTGNFGSGALKDLHAAQSAWNRYLSLNPPHPDVSLANKMSQALIGIRDYAGAATAFEVVVNSQPPSAGLYARLAEYAYAARETRKGDLASQKAISLAPKPQQAVLKQQLEAFKKNPTGTSGAGAATGTTTG